MAGLVVLTDGIHNSSDNVLDAGIEARVPIYPVGVGSAANNLSARRNIELTAVAAPLEAIVNNVTTIAVEVHKRDEGRRVLEANRPVGRFARAGRRGIDRSVHTTWLDRWPPGHRA